MRGNFGGQVKVVAKKMKAGINGSISQFLNGAMEMC
jgi:hypothetical protein